MQGHQLTYSTDRKDHTVELTTDDIALFRSVLKSAVLLVLLARLGRPAGEVELSRILQVHRQTIHKYLRALLATGLVTRIASPPGYSLSAAGRSLLSSAPAAIRLEAGETAQGEGLAGANGCKRPETVNFSPLMANISPLLVKFSPISANFSPELMNFLADLVKNTATTSITINIQKEVVEVIALCAKNSRPGGEIRMNFTIMDANLMTPRENFTTESKSINLLEKFTNSEPDLTGQPKKVFPSDTGLAGANGGNPVESEASDPVDPATWAALMAAGVTPNRRTRRLAALPHVTPDYVTAHHLALQQAGKAHETGLLITILESGAPAPPLNELRHLETCSCPDCQRLKYTRWIPCFLCGGYGCTCEQDECDDDDTEAVGDEDDGGDISASHGKSIERANVPTC